MEDLAILASMAKRARERVLMLERDRTRIANARVVCAALACGRKDYHVAALPEIEEPEAVAVALDDEDAEASRVRLLHTIGDAFEKAEHAHDCLAREIEALSNHAAAAAEKIAAGESFDAHVERVTSLTSEVQRLDVAHRSVVAKNGDLKALLGAYGHDVDAEPSPAQSSAQSYAAAPRAVVEPTT